MFKQLLSPTFSIIFFITILLSCGNDENKTAQRDKSEALTKNEQKSPSHENFYKRLEGTIAGKPVVVHFSKFENKMFFNYYYVSQGIPIGLYANQENKLKGDSIELIEWDRQKKDFEERGDNKWHIVISENGVSGIWIARDGKTTAAITLKENYPSGSSLFNVVGKSDSYSIKFTTDTVAANSYMMMMEPSDATNSKWFTEKIVENIWGDDQAASSSIQSVIEDETKSYFEEYKAEIDTMRMNRDLADSGSHFALNYENEINANAIYNDNGFLVLDVGSYGYFGGAHGIQGSTVLCYDMKEKKEMNLNDVISIDSVTLQKIVEKNFRINSGLKPNQSLKEFLFENKLPANDNFYFTNKGLGFVYQPYEVAAYVYGIIYVFIPYTDLKAYLNPHFMQRMGLE